MSQIANMQAEHASLKQEVQFLENGLPLDQAATKLIQFMLDKAKEDSLLGANPNDNEWIVDREQAGCCEIQ
eukprot:UN00052